VAESAQQRLVRELVNDGWALSCGCLYLFVNCDDRTLRAVAVRTNRSRGECRVSHDEQ
jgi:hypothetical protein